MLAEADTVNVRRMSGKVARRRMPGLFLYSAVPYLKYYVQKQFKGDIHHVWCSERFNHQSQLDVSLLPRSPGSSDPCDIIYRARKDIVEKDDHSDLITGWRTGMLGRIAGWVSDGSMSPEDSEEIAYLAKDRDQWRPLLFVIKRDAILPPRLQLVPPGPKRAGPGKEFIIEDLASGEFEVLEFWNADRTR